MPLSVGERLGPYEILAQIGAGGMGEVYRARDTKLDRDVAIKVLPAAVARDPERLARFEREAKVLAALNHPNIASIYGLEDRAIVMELVEGPTLAERIQTGPLLLKEVLTITLAIADALEAAHDKGIVHRDLKPANVKAPLEGLVKVLDLGLATALPGGDREPSNAANSPTLTMGATEVGVILGTAAYMSPEQASGRRVDKRADIWSFGVVMWEMLTGQHLFDGETISHTLAEVLRGPIDFGKLPKETPRVVRDLLRRCLDRDVKTRLRDIGESRVVIAKYLADPNGENGGPPRANAGLTWVVSAMLFAAAALALAFVHFREKAAPVSVPVRFQISPPEKSTFANTAVLSPDGQQMVFEASGPDGRVMLWVRPLDSLEMRPLAGTEGAQPGPFWSPDGRFIAFGVNGFPGKMKKVEASGGPPQTLCDYSGNFREGAWNREGVILFGVLTSGLWRVSDAGGTASQVTNVDYASHAEVQHAGPAFLPDGRRFLYHRLSRRPGNDGIYLGTLDANPEQQSSKRLLAADSDPSYVASSDADRGYVLFLRDGSLFVQPFDGRRVEFTGEARPIVEGIGSTGSYGWFSASATGSLAFRASGAEMANGHLLWSDRQGKQLGQVGPPAESSSSGVQLSPDGKKVIVTRSDSLARGAPRAWTADLARGIFSRLNPGDGTEGSPAVAPDGRVAFTSTLNGALGDLYWMPASGVGAPEPLLVKSPTIKHPNHISLDGRFLIYDDHHPTQRQDLWILPLTAPSVGERKPIPFLVTQADETFGQFSPDGKWIAYSSDESGRREVYVQGFAPDHIPAAGVGKWQISTAGGDKPRWRRDGRELYYIAPDRKMMAVPVKTDPTFEPGIGVPLFETRVTGFFPYDVSADGRFLLNTVADTDTPVSSPITVVLNWTAGLKE